MRMAAMAALIVGSVAVSISVGSPQTAPAPQAFLQKYCLSCHTEGSREKGLVPIALDKLDLSRISKDAEVWEKVARRVEAGVMPPTGASRPDCATARQFAAWLTGEWDRAAQAHPKPGRPLLH